MQHQIIRKLRPGIRQKAFPVRFHQGILVRLETKF
jgi:hypothetical protein